GVRARIGEPNVLPPAVVFHTYRPCGWSAPASVPAQLTKTAPAGSTTSSGNSETKLEPGRLHTVTFFHCEEASQPPLGEIARNMLLSVGSPPSANSAWRLGSVNGM